MTWQLWKDNRGRGEFLSSSFEENLLSRGNLSLTHEGLTCKEGGRAVLTEGWELGLKSPLQKKWQVERDHVAEAEPERETKMQLEKEAKRLDDAHLNKKNNNKKI